MGMQKQPAWRVLEVPSLLLIVTHHVDNNPLSTVLFWNHCLNKYAKHAIGYGNCVPGYLLAR